MIIIEIIGEFIARFFVDIIVEGIIYGFFRLIRKGYDFLKRKIFGLPDKPINLITSLEKELLYKEIRLLTDINPKIKKGLIGVILEVLDRETVYAEFLDNTGNQIEYRDEFVFEVKTNQFEMIRKNEKST